MLACRQAWGRACHPREAARQDSAREKTEQDKVLYYSSRMPEMLLTEFHPVFKTALPKPVTHQQTMSESRHKPLTLWGDRGSPTDMPMHMPTLSQLCKPLLDSELWAR